MKKNIKFPSVLSLAAFALTVFASSNISAVVEENIPFSGGQYVTTWNLNDFMNIPERSGLRTFWNWLMDEGYDPTEYIKHDVDVFSIEFHTNNPLGVQTKASAYISIPTGVTGPMPIVINYYGTMGGSIHRHTHRPSTWASKGFIVLTPHYLSQNKSAGKDVHPYIMLDPYGEITKDLLTASKAILDQNNISYTEDLLLQGVSEGAFAALSAAKILQENNIPVTLAAPYAGPYNIEAYVAGFLSAPPAIGVQWIAAYTAVKLFLATTSYSDYFPGTLHENENYIQKIKANMPVFLREPFASAFVDAYLDLENQVAKLLEIQAIYNALPSREREPLPWGLVKPEVRDLLQADPYGNPLTQFYALQNCCFWRPEMNVLFLHGDADANIPVQMTVGTYQLLKYGYQAPHVDIITYPGLDHYAGVLPARKDTIDAFCNLLATS